LFAHAERDPGIQGGGDERMPQGVPPDRLGDSGADGDPADDPGGTVPAQPPDRDRAGGVAAGRRELTNGAVAGRLYIWPHTVNTPPAARVAKRGGPDRVALAAVAHHLIE